MKESLLVAQISDCHLFSDPNGLHCGANVYQHLSVVLKHVNQVTKPDVIIFTGDLTQDHTDGSYANFVKLFAANNISVPVHFLAGNHDEFQMLDHHLGDYPFNSTKTIENSNWQILLMESKSDIPSGLITEQELQRLNKTLDPNKKQLLMMHHHPIDVGYFIDKHGMVNKQALWTELDTYPSIVAISCGHVHQAIALPSSQSGYSLPLYTCPATSIQFDISQESSSCNGQGAGYRMFELFDNGKFVTKTYFISEIKQETPLD